MGRKKIILLAAGLLALAGAASGLTYLNKAVLPKIAREKIIIAVSDITQGKVTLDDIRIGLFKGVVVSGLSVSEKDRPEAKLLEIHELSANFLFVPFFKKGGIVIPSLRVKGATLFLSRRKDKTLNIDSLIDALKKNSGSPKNIFIGALDITDSTMAFADEAIEPSPSFTLNLTRLSAKITAAAVIAQVQGSVLRAGKEAAIEIRGSYAFRERRPDGNFRIKGLDVAFYRAYLPALAVTLEDANITEFNAAFSADKGLLKIKANAVVEKVGLTKDKSSLKCGSLNAIVTLSAPQENPRDFNAAGKITIGGGNFSVKEGVTADGAMTGVIKFSATSKQLTIEPALKISQLTARKEGYALGPSVVDASAAAVIPLKKEENAQITYRGQARLASEALSGLPVISEAREIAAEARFENDDIDIIKIAAKILETPIEAKGKITQGAAVLEANGDFDLARLLAVAPAPDELKNIALEGTAALSLHTSFPLPLTQAPPIRGEAHLANLSFKHPESHFEVSAAGGRVKFDTEAQTLEGHFENITCFGRVFRLDATAKNFTSPAVHAVAIGEDFKLESDFTKKDDAIAVSQLKGNYKNSSVDARGTVGPDGHFEATALLRLDTQDLPSLLPSSRDALEKIGLQGRFFVEAGISGPMKNWRRWTIKAQGESDAARFYGLVLTHIDGDYIQTNGEGFLNRLSFDVYSGKGALSAKAAFGEKNIGYACRGILENIDLGRLKADTPLAEKPFAGLLSFNIAVQGDTSDLKTLSGGGNLVIKNGNLWEFNPLKGLGNFLFIPRFSSIVFTSAQGDFFIKDNAVTTDNFELLGTELGLIAEGRLGFDGTLEFLVNTQIVPAQGLQEATGLPLPGEVIETVSKAASMTAIKITGTVREPKYKLQPIAENIMKKLGDLLSNLVP